MLPGASIDEIHIYFPDPWPRKREQKRRIIRAEALAEMRRTLVAGGSGIYVTDHREYFEIAAPLIFSDVVKTEPLIKTAAASFLVVLLGAALFVYGSDVSHDLLSRALLGNVDVPRKTRVEEISKDAIVAIGDAFTIEARARGINPDSGTVKMTSVPRPSAEATRISPPWRSTTCRAR